MKRRRKPWQHDFEIKSEDQIKELIHNLGWEVNRFGRDYGEDLWVQMFKDGNPSREVFFIQLKGTDNSTQYALQSGVFSYPIDVVNLAQWFSYPFPVIVVLWDITNRFGYWLHIQPYIANTLKSSPGWLNDLDAERQVHIPPTQIFSSLDTHSLSQTIETEYKQIALGRKHLEDEQQKRIEDIDRALAPIQEMEASDGSRAFPPQVRQQAQLARYEAILSGDPTNADALMGKAGVYYELQEMDKALVTVNKLWGLGRRDPHTAWLRGCIFTEYAIANGNKPQSMLHEAIALFNSASSITSPSLLNYNVGNALSALGKYEEAIAKYDQALAATPQKPRAAEIWKNRGTCFFHLKNHDEEIRSYKNAIHENPNLWEAYSSWAITEIHLGDLNQAKDLLLTTFKVNPGLRESNFALAYTLAHALWKTGESDKAYEWVNQVLHVNPNHIDAKKLKALLLAELWRRDPVYRIAAIPFFKNALVDDPSNIMIQTELFLLNNGEGVNDEALALLDDDAGLERIPPDLLYDCAMIFAKEGETNRAIKFLEIAFKTSQKHHIVHKLANLKMETGDYKRAIELYKLALRDVRDPHPILRSIADCSFFLKEYKTCIAIMVKFLLGEPHNSTWWTNLAFVLKESRKASIIVVFWGLPVKLENQEDVADIEIQEIIDHLLAELRQEFGGRFVSSIVNSETDFI